MPTNFEFERLKPKLDIFKIPENRVHELTDSNVSRMSWVQNEDEVKTKVFLKSLSRQHLAFLQKKLAIRIGIGGYNSPRA